MPWQNGEFVYDSSDQTSTETNTEENDSIDAELKRMTGAQRLEEEQPIANEPAASAGIAARRGDLSETGAYRHRDVQEDAIFNRLRQSPEVISLLQAIIDDIIGPGATFEYVGRTDGDYSPQKRIERAEKFWTQNQDTFANGLIDEFTVGDMYIYKRRNDEVQVKNVLDDLLTEHFEFNHKSSVDTASNVLTDELKAETNMFDLQELQLVAASTMEHEINRYGDIQNFVQKVNGNENIIPRDQIMHDSYMKVNGKTYGFTPFLSLFTELDMLANAKNHNAQVFDNAGVVNKIFKLPDEGPNDQNYEMVKKTVAKYRQLQNKYRDLVLTGNIEVEDMNSIGDSMEFRELAQYVTNVLIMAWGVPPTRVGTDIGKSSRGTQLSHEGYFKRVKRLQNKYEAFLNEELFEPVFSVRIQFNHPDTKHEIREADRDLRRLDVTKQMVALGLWDSEEAMKNLDVNATELPENFSEEDFREAAMEIAGLQGETLDDETVNGDTAEDAARGDLREGQNTNLQENDGQVNDA